MQSILQPWQLLLWALAAWVQREQQEEIDYLRTEVAVLKEKLGKKRILLSDDQRRRLAHIERFFGSLKSECLDHLILFGEQSLRNTVREYLVHYHEERPHQGLDNQLIVPLERLPDTDSPIEATERLGGLLRSYRRAA